MKLLEKIYLKLFKAYGKQGWWPVTSSSPESRQLEICLGAILTQNTSWKNVEKALANLQAEKLFCLEKLRAVPIKRLESLIRPSGYYRQKAKKIKAFVTRVLESGGFKKFFSKPNLREELLSVWGIGPETADSIILYAAKKPIFVVDAYTKRLFAKLGLVNENATYDEVKAFFEKTLKPDLKIYQEYHALIVENCKRHCMKKPACSECVLKGLCKAPRSKPTTINC